MQIKLKTNLHSIESNKIPYYTDWEHVETCQLGDVQDTFFDQGEIDCMLIMGKDGKSMEDYFAWVELGDLKPSTDPEAMEGEMEFVSTGERVWIHHSFIYNLDGSKLHI